MDFGFKRRKRRPMMEILYTCKYIVTTQYYEFRLINMSSNLFSHFLLYLSSHVPTFKWSSDIQASNLASILIISQPSPLLLSRISFTPPDQKALQEANVLAPIRLPQSPSETVNRKRRATQEGKQFSRSFSIHPLNLAAFKFVYPSTPRVRIINMAIYVSSRC